MLSGVVNWIGKGSDTNMAGRPRKYDTDNPHWEAVQAYRSEHKIKRVPLDMPLSDYETLVDAATQAGETVNGFIKRAISDRIARIK